MPYEALVAPTLPQVNCPLFIRLPGEVRTAIFEFALSDYEDLAARYPTHVSYARPGYFAPRRCAVSLLRTCRAVYRETWSMPAAFYRHTIWRTSQAFQPPKKRNRRNSRMTLASLTKMQSEMNGGKPIQVEDLQIFVSTRVSRFTALRVPIIDNSEFRRITEVLHPRQVTITVCHFDRSGWQGDANMWCCSKELDSFCLILPLSVKEIVMELETVPRKRRELKRIARRICKTWFFKPLMRGETHQSDEVDKDEYICRLDRDQRGFLCPLHCLSASASRGAAGWGD